MVHTPREEDDRAASDRRDVKAPLPFLLRGPLCCPLAVAGAVASHRTGRPVASGCPTRRPEAKSPAVLLQEASSPWERNNTRAAASATRLLPLGIAVDDRRDPPLFVLAAVVGQRVPVPDVPRPLAGVDRQLVLRRVPAQVDEPVQVRLSGVGKRPRDPDERRAREGPQSSPQTLIQRTLSLSRACKAGSVPGGGQEDCTQWIESPRAPRSTNLSWPRAEAAVMAPESKRSRAPARNLEAC